MLSRHLQKLWRSPIGRGKRAAVAGTGGPQSSQQLPGSSLDVSLLRQLEPLASLTPASLAAAATDANLDGARSAASRALVRPRLPPL